jgi:signal transduction histidine kinase
LLALFANALEAMSQAHHGGRITVRTGFACDEGRECVTIEVTDDGPGIPANYLDRVFEPFFTTKEEGTGYGLYMASEILKEQQGRLTARNCPDGGACFTVWLPAAPAQSLTESSAT